MPGSGYTAITFVANEQPTTAKWNLIGSNFESLVDGSGFDDNFIVNRHIAVEEITGDKLSTENIAVVNYRPGGNVDTTSSTLADWLNAGNITVPSWASNAILSIAVSGILVTSAANVTARIKLGGVKGSVTARVAGSNTAANQYLDVAWNDTIAVTPGTRALVLQGSRSAGTLRASTVSVLSVSIRFTA